MSDEAAPPPRRGHLALRCVLAGLAIAAAVPPWGWWPLAFVGIALVDGLVADASWQARMRRTWLAVVCWLAPSMVWMWDMTPPGYLLAVTVYSGYFAIGVALTPPGRWRRLALPGAFVLAEISRWSFPFGGVPLATLPQGQADQPLAVVVALGGPLLLAALVVAGGQALAAARRRDTLPAAVVLCASAILVGITGLLPDSRVVDTLRIAAVQGGGAQRTRAEDTDMRKVFEKHLARTDDVTTPVDVVLWPEDVVDIDGVFAESKERKELAALARRLDAVLIVGVVEDVDDDEFANFAVAFGPDGEVLDRYDKVRIVPFGEWVPMRGLLERLSSQLPDRDARAGSGPGILDTPKGVFGVTISWEEFFANRGRQAALAGGAALLNPTNGSSYWLTQVQTQQLASSRLRALEADRWVVQAAPTGFSAIVAPSGRIVARSAISEPAVVEGVIELRRGQTPYVRFGDAPMILAAAAAMVCAWLGARRDDRRRAPAMLTPTRRTDEGTAPSPGE